jgi:ubiquinone/menaquinone biosynthesis C-methylase UbiE
VSVDLNPQVQQMADESMVRTLSAQAQAIWPQEVRLFERHGLPATASILDVGCGTGEVTSRLAEHFPKAEVLGVDILSQHVDYARQRYASLAPRLRFEQADAFKLQLPDARFDLTVCRHVMQSVPHPERILAELVRVTRPGGRVHLLVEDYEMIHQSPTRVDLTEFWHQVVTGYGRAHNTDLAVGRRGWVLCHELGLQDVRVDYVTVDTVRVPREIFAAIITAWRDGYAEVISQHTRYSLPEVLAHFNDLIASILDPHAYAVWHVPIVSATVPTAGSRATSRT